jgi:tight adherence protein B
MGAQGELTITAGPPDLSAYPQSSFLLQLGGVAAATMGDLTKDAVTLEVDGRPVPVDTLRVAGEGIAAPIQTVLLIDESGSMKGEAIAAASQAASAFIDSMRPADIAAIQAFNDQFRTLQTFTNDKNSLKASLAGLNPQKETSLYDAVIKAVSSFDSGPQAARYVIILSDGGDTTSIAQLEQALTAVRSAGIPVYVIGLKTTEFDSQPLVRLAEASGSRYLETPDAGALTSLYQTLAKEIRNQYLVEFTMPPSSMATGELQVKVTFNGLTAEAGRGFFYPTTTTAPSVSTTTTIVPSPAGPTDTNTGEGGGSLLGRFLRWQAADYIIGVLVFLLVLAALRFLFDAVFPPKNVLAEYSSAMDRRADLGPRPVDEAPAKQGSLAHAAGRLLALRGYQDPLQRLIDDASIKLRASEFALIQLVSVVVLAVLARVAGASLLIVVVIVMVVILLPLLWLSSKGTARRRLFNDQVPNTLTLLAGSLKAGQGFEQALAVTARESAEPTSFELQRALAQIRLGVSPEDALRSLAESMRSEAFDWAVMSTIIQRQVGGNLAEIYESTAYTLRERAKLRRQIRTLTAEGRLSALILIILPFAIAALIAIINWGYLAPLFSDKLGFLLLGIAAVLMVIGIFWIRIIVRVDK